MYIYISQFSDDDSEKYLLTPKNPAKKLPLKKTDSIPERAQTAEELQNRLEILRNKHQSKKSKPSERALKKKQEKKMKKSKDKKQHLVSAAKSMKNEKVKEGKVKYEDEDSKENVFDGEDVKQKIKAEKVFNEEGKMVFSKFEFAARPSQAKKTKRDSELLIYLS